MGDSARARCDAARTTRDARRFAGNAEGSDTRLATARSEEGEASSLRRRVGADLAATASAHAAYKLTGLVVMMILTRSLSKESFGSFLFATSIAGIGGPLTALGLTTLLVRDVAVDGARASEHASRTLAIRVPLLALLVIVLAAGTAIIRPPLATIVFWSALALALDEISLTFGAYFSGLARFRLASALGVGGKLLGVAAVFVAALAGANVEGFLIAMVLANGVRLAATFVAARRVGFRWAAHAAHAAHATRPTHGAHVPHAPHAADGKRALVMRALPLFALGATATLHFRGDAVLLGWLGTFALVATYETAFRLFEAAQSVTRPVAMVFYPLFASRLAAGQHAWVAARFRRILAIAVGLGVVGAALVYALADPLVPMLFGADYVESVPVMRTLYLALPSFLVVLMCGMMARSMGLERRAVVISAACLALGLVAKVAVIPHAGAVGVAWCTAAVFVVQAIAMARAVLLGLAAPHAGLASVVESTSAAPARIDPLIETAAEDPEAPAAI